MTTLILLGAGASYGSFDNLEDGPPLGNGANGLFSRLMMRSDAARKMDLNLQQRFTQNFEDGMSEYFIKSDGNVASLQLAIGKYLASFTPRPTNIYFDLLAACNLTDTVFASLNYDTLLEECILTRRRKIEYSLSIRPHHTRVVKPHGSSNFWPDFPIGMISRSSFTGVGTDIDAPIKPLPPNQSRARYQIEDSFSPCMSMYAPSKRVKTSPAFVLRQQNFFSEAAKLASQIFVIGVRVHPEDAHIWDALTRSNAELHYFGMESDQVDFNSWQTGRAQFTKFHESSFSGVPAQIRSLLK